MAQPLLFDEPDDLEPITLLPPLGMSRTEQVIERFRLDLIKSLGVPAAVLGCNQLRTADNERVLPGK
ncbi:hypothetical protein [Sporomusa acidovorans]|uniref:Uncharacterized protein n=1 Tax=Sporomusa acidovorans (strain ATCC 49682 / DSM 3132 / Mol) TaxID=1123286 RepID=A0ABZ3J9V7_SPOA4|nr:hypothetical protein [Sporomusa acidovorans]OZC16026.1 hypothetical protein SPACI_43920 [Sporomusa acidovorans DSM 3132]SDD89274.1 hypothetical protein SAMN04488499_1005105 [Sporomusa acidovorans]